VIHYLDIYQINYFTSFELNNDITCFVVFEVVALTPSSRFFLSVCL